MEDVLKNEIKEAVARIHIALRGLYDETAQAVRQECGTIQAVLDFDRKQIEAEKLKVVEAEDRAKVAATPTVAVRTAEWRETPRDDWRG